MMPTEMALRAAMHNTEFVVHYQPIVDLTRGAVVGVEALIRWQHPTDGLIQPDDFIPVAESSGLIVALGAWVLEQAVTQTVRWRADGLNLDVAVNMSTRQVAHPDLVPTVARVVRDSGIEPSHLVLEVTESAVMEDADAAVAVLTHLTELGISLAIDDFGTGYSSLVYLKRYPIRALKVDRSFTTGMGVYAEDDAIIASVIELAKAVGGFCIAEGIETEEQYAALRSLHCGFGQGWLFGKAVPALELPELITRCEAKLATLGQPVLSEKEQREQTADQRDRDADQREQAADQREQAADQREHSANQRDQAGDQRDHVGDQRDQAGDQRDQAGDQRDEAGDQRDQAADQREEAGDQGEPGLSDEVTTDTFVRFALARREAASRRTGAARDRQQGADARSQADLDRRSALTDRGVSATERDAATGALTGTYLPAARLRELEREMSRARRTKLPLVLAFIDVDRFDAASGSHSHASGNRMLHEVAAILGSGVRSFDLVYRPGGDAFVWALSGLDLASMTRRLALLNANLADASAPGLVRFGLAELGPGDSAEDLVTRASAELRLAVA